MFSTIPNKGRKDLGLERDRIERQLAQVERDDVRGDYDVARRPPTGGLEMVLKRLASEL